MPMPEFPMIPEMLFNPLNISKDVAICPIAYPTFCAVSGFIFFINSVILSMPPGSLFTNLLAFSDRSSKKLRIPVPTFSASGSSASQNFLRDLLIFPHFIFVRKLLKAFISRGSPFLPKVHFPSGFRKCSQKSFRDVQVKFPNCFKPSFHNFCNA